MRPLIAIILLISLTSCSSWSGQSIVSKSTVVTGRNLDRIRLRFKHDPLPCNVFIRVLKIADTSSYDLISSVDSNNNILKVTLLEQNKSASTEIAVSNSVGNYTYEGKLGDTILCEQTPNFWFIAWINEAFYQNKIGGDLNKNHKYEFHIMAIEKRSGRQIADQIVYTTQNATDCCLDRLDIKYNPYTQSILYAFNDFGGSAYKILYGYISVQKDKINFKKPYDLIFKDGTEKRQPIFVDNGRNIYLYHTTGDNWEYLAGHMGKQQIAIFQIDSLNKLINHRTVNDTSEIDQKILFIGDTIFYRLKDNNEYDKMTIKKIAWQDLKEN